MQRVAHPVKVERHDVFAHQHHTNTGSRPVQTYRTTPHGLYVSRAFVDHPRIAHWQAHLLPAHDLVVCRYDFHAGREHDYHLDVARISRCGAVWEVRDLYLDLLVHAGLTAEIVDTDELLDAHAAGLIGEAEMHHAISVAHRTLSALAKWRYSLRAMLAEQGVVLEWAGELAPA